VLSGSLGKATGAAKGFVAGNGNSKLNWAEQAVTGVSNFGADLPHLLLPSMFVPVEGLHAI
jgi:hypothetical protein